MEDDYATTINLPIYFQNPVDNEYYCIVSAKDTMFFRMAKKDKGTIEWKLVNKPNDFEENKDKIKFYTEEEFEKLDIF